MESKPSTSAQRIACKPPPDDEDEGLDESARNMSDNMPFFIASFSGMDKDR